MTTTFPVPQTKDLDRLVALMRAFSLDQHTPFDEPRTRANIRSLTLDETYAAIRMIQDAGVVVGYLVVTFGFSFEFGGPDAFIDEIYVVPAHRGRGLGRQAVAEAERLCEARDVRALHLEMDADNAAALRVCRSAGFRDHDRRLMSKQLVRS